MYDQSGEVSRYLVELYERRTNANQGTSHILHVMGPSGMLAEAVRPEVGTTEQVL